MSEAQSTRAPASGAAGSDTATASVAPSAASAAAAAAAAPSASPPPAAAAASISFSFASAAARPRRVAPSVAAALSIAARPLAAEGSAERQLVTGSLTAASLATAHRRAQEGPAMGSKGLVIPLIKQTNWRAASGVRASAAGEGAPPQSSAAGVTSSKARETGSGGIAFESEQDLMDAAYEAKQAARAAEAAAAAAGAASAAQSTSVDDMPALQTVAETAVSLDEQAAAALMDDAESGASHGGPSLPSAEQQDAFARAAPILVANALPGNSKMLSEEERIALDVQQRPPEASLDDYARVPISEFGAGMLRGMGWGGLGDPIGGINKAVCEPVQFAPRGERMGLGASFAKVKDNRGPKKFIKPGETRAAVGVVRVGPTAAAPASAAGPTPAEMKAKTLRALGSRLIQVHSQQLREGALVEVLEGPHRKSYGRVVSFGDPASVEHADEVEVEVRLTLSDQTVKLLRNQMDILDERAMPEDHPAFETADMRAKRLAQEAEAAARFTNGRDEAKAASSSSSSSGASSKRDRSSRYDRDEEDRSSSKKRRGSRERDSERDRERERDRDRDRRRDHSHRSRSRSRSRDRADRHSHSSRAAFSSHSGSSSSAAAASSSSGGPPRWVRPHIRVRIVSTSFAGGAYYRHKGTVVDVASSSHVLVRPDGGGRVLEGLSERQLESVLPAAGTSRVMLLRGPHKGEVGTLLQKQNDKAKAVVQMEEDLNIITVDFDDVAEFVA